MLNIVNNHIVKNTFSVNYLIIFFILGHYRSRNWSRKTEAKIEKSTSKDGKISEKQEIKETTGKSTGWSTTGREGKYHTAEI